MNIFIRITKLLALLVAILFPFWGIIWIITDKNYPRALAEYFLKDK